MTFFCSFILGHQSGEYDITCLRKGGPDTSSFDHLFTSFFTHEYKFLCGAVVTLANFTLLYMYKPHNCLSVQWEGRCNLI